ncbi:hypothetical protein SAMN04490207_5249 [Pseudomonas gessardii]|uniref:Uncharacterized protein n=1 Tax=Pseudomonas gessardii TaxID=78544 RepID=A0A7Y1QPR5_9PSED|nr:hypothetical protein [Pseudomonas gessardii]MRU50121.1 hypothetical protein [Pseudomonas gessardii]NNA98897.1 hypothetical protein [Pseudomonas gessardii]ONH46323.1 hypothetical protein BLL38_07180 [Pseudomonas gessardii]SDR33602.1 hypothetical protein SAMN04490207_5249 [Pseudomonas gessardii]
MRTLNTLTQNLIENLIQLLEQPGEEALQTLVVCAPMLVEQLQQVLLRAADRRDVEAQLRGVLGDWLRQHPQEREAEHALIEAMERQSLITPALRGHKTDKPENG